MEFKIAVPSGWQDYELLDSGDGEKLERYGAYTIRRPDPQILWKRTLPESEWRSADASFLRTIGDKGDWRTTSKLPESWEVHWQNITLHARLSPFKHTGIFPEQSAHWQWIRDILAADHTQRPDYQPNILNLFAYTGGASVVCAAAGAKITHVDASRSSIGWAKQNQLASGLDERSIRWILDDVMKFVRREATRGVQYDGIIMDPPVYGHGPAGERWEFKESLPQLLEVCQNILSPQPLFFVINAYAVSTSAVTLGNLVDDLLGKLGGKTEMGELALTQKSGRMISTGIFARWQTESGKSKT